MILAAEIRELIGALRSEIADLRRENEALRADNAALRAEAAELRRRLDLDSSKSSKPPSSDGLRKKPRSWQPSRTLGQAERRADRAQGRHA